MHELACVSGIAAAYRLGVDYVKFDDFAEDFFSKYLLLSHGVRYGAEQKRRKQKRSQVWKRMVNEFSGEFEILSCQGQHSNRPKLGRRRSSLTLALFVRGASPIRHNTLLVVNHSPGNEGKPPWKAWKAIVIPIGALAYFA